jgi:hypothetical protein
VGRKSVANSHQVNGDFSLNNFKELNSANNLKDLEVDSFPTSPDKSLDYLTLISAETLSREPGKAPLPPLSDF